MAKAALCTRFLPPRHFTAPPGRCPLPTRCPLLSCRPAGSLTLAFSPPFATLLSLVDSLPLVVSLPFPFCAALPGAAQRGMRFAHVDVSALPYFNQTANARIPV